MKQPLKNLKRSLILLLLSPFITFAQEKPIIPVIMVDDMVTHTMPQLFNLRKDPFEH